MASLDFPSSPTNGQTYSSAGVTWTYNSTYTVWNVTSSGPVGYSGSQGYTGSKGDIGYSGSLGYTGSKGTDGVIGYNGSVGYTGSKGDIGYTGSLGYTGSGATGVNWTNKSTTYTAVNNDGIIANTSGGSFTVTLPASPAAGSYVVFVDGGNSFQAYPLTVAGNGSTIDVSYTSAVLNITNAKVEFIYSGSTWEMATSTGTRGYTGSLGYTGSVGYTGSQGYTGSASTVIGYTGSKGDIGYTGSIPAAITATSLALGGATLGAHNLAVSGTAIISGNTGIGTTSPQTLLTLNAGSGNDGTGEATYHGLIQLDGYYTGTSDLTTVSGIEWKTAYGSGGSGFRQTGLYNSSSGVSTLVFAGRQASASWSTLMTLTGGGLLGIGGTPANQVLNVFATSSATTSTSPCGIRIYDNGYSNSVQICGRNGQLQLNASSHVFLEADAEVARIDTSGNLGIGASPLSTSISTRKDLTINGSSSGAIISFGNGGVRKGYIINDGTDSQYVNESTGVIKVIAGSLGVQLANGGTSWTSLSDESMKTFTDDITDAASKVASLRTKIGYYTSDEKKTLHPFLVAQDVQTVLPEAITVYSNLAEPKDPMNGKLLLSYTDVVPLLVAAIKELTTRLEALEAK